MYICNLSNLETLRISYIYKQVPRWVRQGHKILKMSKEVVFIWIGCCRDTKLGEIEVLNQFVAECW